MGREPEHEATVLCTSASTDRFTNRRTYEIYLVDGEYFVVDNHQNQIGVFRSLHEWGRFLTNNGVSAFMEF